MTIKDWLILSLCFLAISVLIAFVGQYAVFPLSIVLCLLSLASLAISIICVIVAGYEEMAKLDKMDKEKKASKANDN